MEKDKEKEAAQEVTALTEIDVPTVKEVIQAAEVAPPSSGSNRSKNGRPTSRHSSRPGRSSSDRSNSSNPTLKSKKPCIRYLKGTCRWGPYGCSYQHTGVCRDWRKGNCSNPKCKYLHKEVPKQQWGAAVATNQQKPKEKTKKNISAGSSSRSSSTKKKRDQKSKTQQSSGYAPKRAAVAAKGPH